MGSAPEWYRLMRAADRLHCKPFELLHEHPIWITWAMWAIEAENEASKPFQSRNPQNNKAKNKRSRR